MNITQVANSIGKLIKEGSKSGLVDFYKIEIETLDMQRGNFIAELLHRTANKIKYVKEPVGRDDWQTADETLIKTQGDCEDYTILIGATLLKAGYPVLIKFTASGKEFDHITPMSWDGQRWVVLDATLGNVGLDFEGSYVKSIIYTVDGAPINESDLYNFGWLGWLALAAVVAILLLRAVVGG